MIIAALILAFLSLRWRKFKHSSRLRHDGNVAAAGLYPASQKQQEAGELQKQNTWGTEPESAVSPLEAEGVKGGEEDVHEVEGKAVPAYSRELYGSPGVRRSELPERRGSV